VRQWPGLYLKRSEMASSGSGEQPLWHAGGGVQRCPQSGISRKPRTSRESRAGKSSNRKEKCEKTLSGEKTGPPSWYGHEGGRCATATVAGWASVNKAAFAIPCRKGSCRRGGEKKQERSPRERGFPDYCRGEAKGGMVETVGY